MVHSFSARCRRRWVPWYYSVGGMWPRKLDPAHDPQAGQPPTVPSARRICQRMANNADQDGTSLCMAAAHHSGCQPKSGVVATSGERRAARTCSSRRRSSTNRANNGSTVPDARKQPVQSIVSFTASPPRARRPSTRPLPIAPQEDKRHGRTPGRFRSLCARRLRLATRPGVRQRPVGGCAIMGASRNSLEGRAMFDDLPTTYPPTH